MVEILKNWISTMLCVGIFITFIKMIIPNTKIAKYIYSLVGVMTVVTLVMSISKYLNVDKVEEATQSVLNSIEASSKNQIEIDNNDSKEILNENLKKEFIKKIKNDIQSKLNENNISTELISVIVDEKFNIQKINIKINKNLNYDLIKINSIFEIIQSNYNLESNKVSIEEV